ncbi:hypothetical protein BG004_002996 [Podila humilis]|nr:hypothetical protein BG004_002996 [Podila humilis]
MSLGGTLWLTLQIPFGTNCGNTHRGLMGVVLAVIVVGMCLPLYYHYIEKDLVKKEFSRQQKLASQGDLEQQQQLLQPNIFYYYDEKHKNKLKKKSVLASKRFAIALFVTGFILQIIVVLGYYYLWSDHNHCTDSRQWVVKGWFIALLIVTVAVIVCMIGVMFRSRRERKILNRMREREDDNGRHTSDMDIDTKHGMEKSMPYATTMTTMKG